MLMIPSYTVFSLSTGCDTESNVPILKQTYRFFLPLLADIFSLCGSSFKVSKSSSILDIVAISQNLFSIRQTKIELRLYQSSVII